MIKIGIDTGGTFTDIVILQDGKITTRKVLSDRSRPDRGLMAGLSDNLDKNFKLTYGTTIATNAFLEKKGAKTAFVSTLGFQHLLHLQRQNRLEVFSLLPSKADTIVELDYCIGIHERVLFDGSLERKIEQADLEKTAQFLFDNDISCISIVFLHSYKNNINEKHAEQYFRQKGFFVSASYNILPEQKEYERAVVTTLNSYLMPVVQKHIDKICSVLKRPFFIMQSGGGFLSPEAAQEQPIRTVLSGPVGGVIAAHYYKEDEKIITLDMGGTSTDISLIEDDIIITQETELEGLPIRIPTVFIKTVGAGGGSIAWIDKAGVLKLGPASAGSDPGPACYGRSETCTLTDAYVAMGYILPELFLGGQMNIFPEKSRKAIEILSTTLKKDLYETAEGIVDLSIVLMEKALRNVILQKGHNPAKFALMPFGGAGGLAAVELAEKLGIRKIIIPPYQGVFSAVGMLLAKSTRDLSLSVLKPLSNSLMPELACAYKILQKRISKEIARDFEEKTSVSFIKSVDMRYAGQTYYINVPYRNTAKGLVSLFNRIHKKIYSYSFNSKEIEIVNIRLKGFSKGEMQKLPPEETLPKISNYPKAKGIVFKGKKIQAKFYIKECMLADARITGPAILSSKHSTVFIPPMYQAIKSNKGTIAITPYAI